MVLALDGSGHSNASASSPTVTLTTSNADNVIIVIVTSNAAPVASVTSSGLTWIFIAADGLVAGQQCEMWYAIASSALTSHVITVNNTGGGFTTIDAFGVSGANTSDPFDGNASTPATSPSAILSVSTDTADTFIVGGYRFNSTDTSSQGTGFTLISGLNFQLSEYKIVSTTQSSLSIAIGTGSGNQNGGVAVAIKQAAAVGGAIPIFRRRIEGF